MAQAASLLTSRLASGQTTSSTTLQKAIRMPFGGRSDAFQRRLKCIFDTGGATLGQLKLAFCLSDLGA